MFWNNFIFYCAKNNKAPNTVAKELNLSSGSIMAWKNGVKPRLTTLSKIADYFNITIEDLTDGEKEKAAPISGNGLSEIQQKPKNKYKKIAGELIPGFFFIRLQVQHFLIKFDN